MTDTRSLENRFLGMVSAMVQVASCTRQFQKALVELPESTQATEAMAEALLGGVSKDRLRLIAKASQGDSRRGREMAARLSEWLDTTREVAKASDEPAADDGDGDEDDEAKDGDDTRTAIKALRERYDAEDREVAKGHHENSFRTVNGKRVPVRGYDTSPSAKAGFAHMTAKALAAHPEHGKAGEALGLTHAAREATHETQHPDEFGIEPNDQDHHAFAAEQHDRAYTMHHRIYQDLKDSSFPESRDAAHKHFVVAKFHKEINAYHAGVASGPADTTPSLNKDDNEGQTPKKEVIKPKTDMVE